MSLPSAETYNHPATELWTWRESNPRHLPCKGSVLPLNYKPKGVTADERVCSIQPSALDGTNDPSARSWMAEGAHLRPPPPVTGPSMTEVVPLPPP